MLVLPRLDTALADHEMGELNGIDSTLILGYDSHVNLVQMANNCLSVSPCADQLFLHIVLLVIPQSLLAIPNGPFKV